MLRALPPETPNRVTAPTALLLKLAGEAYKVVWHPCSLPWHIPELRYVRCTDPTRRFQGASPQPTSRSSSCRKSSSTVPVMNLAHPVFSGEVLRCVTGTDMTTIRASLTKDSLPVPRSDKQRKPPPAQDQTIASTLTRVGTFYYRHNGWLLVMFGLGLRAPATHLRHNPCFFLVRSYRTSGLPR